MDIRENYNFWCTSPYFDEDTKAELKNISDNEEEIEERFYKNLEFGTGGLRGIIGAGTNRMNPVSYTHLTLPTIYPKCRSRWSPYH